jgi:hypothetical protein
MSAIKFNNKYRIPSARWADWDYATEGAYYVTICTKDRKHYFGEIRDKEMLYSELGKIALEEWIKTDEVRPDMQLDMACFQVMPNHIHGIVVIGRDERDNAYYTGNKFGPQSKNLASVMRGFKSAVTSCARKLNIPFEWQARYHDRVIRDDDEFRRIAAYIEQNPQKWETDSQNNIHEGRTNTDMSVSGVG